MGSDGLIFLRKIFKVFYLNFSYSNNYFENNFRRLIIHAIEIVDGMKELNPPKGNTL